MRKLKKLYKYESFSPQNLRNLKDQVIYFSSPKQFNDPYDCQLKANIQAPSDEEIEKIRKKYSESADVPERAKKSFLESSNNELKDTIYSSAKKIIKDNCFQFIETNGVTCFSESNEDLLMWAHYGGNYTGFCLEFSTQNEPFSAANVVTYVEELPVVESGKIFLNDNYDDVFNLFCTKSESWSYEKEWRIMHKNAGTPYTYKTTDLSAIYFGPEIDSASLDIICLILKGQHNKIKYFKGKRSETEFKVEFEEFTYSSHLEAKERGLK